MKARYLFTLFLVVVMSASSAAVFADTDVLPSVTNGDYNGDGSRNVTDAIDMFQYLFTGRADPAVPVAAHCDLVDTDDGSKIGHFAPGIRNGDVNGDGSINLADCIYFLNWLFSGGEEPVEIDCTVGNSA